MTQSQISAGQRLGRFEITGALGAGGMGAVYRARDLQLQRDVAIKVLPDAFRNDPDRMRAFEQEARAAASLNHPNVIAVHDVGVHEGIAYIVTELLEGETLRQRMNGSALPPRVAVEYAIQIASGLAAGHERGIVHRDIKPDNLFVTKEGRIKILDFGLAKATDPSGDNTTAAFDETPKASVGGTVAYMSPEQARGLRTDHRSDIFSFGAVLYEMLTGFAPFRRSNAGESIHALLNEEPHEIAGIAPELARIVSHCLEKTPEQRFQNARDLIFGLQSLPAGALSAKPLVPPSRARRSGPWIAVAILAVIIAVVLFDRIRPRAIAVAPDVHRVLRLTDLPGIEEFPAISPDGKSVAFTATVKGRRQIFVKLLAGGVPVQITNDEADHQLPRWTPDGTSLVYFSPGRTNDIEGELVSIPALGGSPRRVIDSISGADVSRDGRLTCFQLSKGKVQLITSSLTGSDVRVVAASVPGHHRYPRWSPDGQSIAFQRGDGVRDDIFVIGRDGGQTRQLTSDRTVIRGLAWLPDSRGIIYASSRDTTIPYLPPLALWQVDVNGSATRRLTPADTWYEQPDVNRGIVTASRVRMRFDLWSFPFDAHDKVQKPATQVSRQSGQVLTPSAAPDGEHVAFLYDSGGHGNIWVISTRTGELRQITFEDDPHVTVGLPLWSPDGRSIAFVSSKGRTGYDFGVWVVDPDGRNPRNIAPRGLGITWSNDSQWLYYVETSAGVIEKVRVTGRAPVKVRSERARNLIGLHGNTLYYVVEHVLVDGRPELEILAATPENGPSRSIARIAASRVPSWQIVNPALSPDGEWLAMPLTDRYTTNIWALSTKSGEWRQVTDFGDRPTFIARRASWAPDGRSIFASVAEGDQDIVAIEGLIAP